MSNNDSESGKAGEQVDDAGGGPLPGDLVIQSAGEPTDVAPETGRLLDPWKAEAVEAEDRQNPIPGGEPECPVCGAEMIRHVEKPPAPRAGGSPFRVRLVCSADECAAWTVYDW
jgi:hypothetical protein